jgi:nitroreductase/SAM-dependent methyltransferase
MSDVSPSEPRPDAPVERPGVPEPRGEAGAERHSGDEESAPIGLGPLMSGPAAQGRGPKDFDLGVPVGPTPTVDFWAAIYGRRSIRKFKPDPVPRELIDQLMHAGIWAPSSCNYQMWDLVAVDDPETNARLAALSSQMGNAPVNVVISYGRDFSEENWANIQSASALIQNMSLAAQVLGLGTFWITQTGDGEEVRKIVGLPYDRMVVAVLAVGFPALVPKAGPKRRPLSAVTHWNHYGGRPIPSSADPEQWHPDDLTTYQRARVLNGLRHNKPRAWEMRAVEAAVERFVPDGKDKLEDGQAPVGRWLDVLPCTGIVADKLASLRRGYCFDVVERSPEVADWCLARVRPRGERFVWPPGDGGVDAPEPGQYDVVTCLFRFEGLAGEEREALLDRLSEWVAPGGQLLVGVVNRRSFHDWTERLRAKRGGPKGVEYVLSPDPNIGPFQAVDPAAVVQGLTRRGLEFTERFGAQAAPQPEEIAFRTRNFSKRGKQLAGGVAKLAGWLERGPGVQGRWGRFQFLSFRRPE